MTNYIKLWNQHPALALAFLALVALYTIIIIYIFLSPHHTTTSMIVDEIEYLESKRLLAIKRGEPVEAINEIEDRIRELRKQI
jgi:hypothetical protein